MPNLLEMDCLVCNGSGELRAGDKKAICPFCSGSGKWHVEEKPEPVGAVHAPPSSVPGLAPAEPQPPATDDPSA